MSNPVLAHLKRLGAPQPDLTWLFTLSCVLEVGRYPLADWNEALSIAVGKKIYCPSYQILSRYLQRAVLGIE